MARSKTVRAVPIIRENPGIPGLAVVDLPFWLKPRGIDRLSPVDRIEREFAYELRNFIIEDGITRVRNGFDRFDFSGSTDTVVGIFMFVTSDGVSHLVRFRTTTVEYWDGSSWVAPTGAPTLTGSTLDTFGVTAWNNRMVFSNGVDGIYEWNFATQTVTALTTTYAARQLTTFIGRIIGSDVRESGTYYPERIRWSARNISTDWTGVGSGYEDFLSTPGGYVDRQMGVIPVNDSLALAFRENSTWLLAETGNFEAPIRVSRLYAGLGTQAPRSLVAVPGGVIGLFNDDVHIVSESEIVSIGRPIWPLLRQGESLAQSAVGVYNHRRKIYVLITQNPSTSFAQIFVYSLRDRAWSRFETPWTVLDAFFTTSPYRGLTIGTSPGTIGAASGTIGSEVGSQGEDLLYLLGVWMEGERIIFKENPAAIEDDDWYGGDIQYITVADGMTGVVSTGDPLKETYIIEIQIKYESDRQVDGEVIFTKTKNADSGPYSYPVSFAATQTPQILRVTKQMVGHEMQIGLRLFNCLGSGFELISMTARAVEGGLDQP